MLWSLNGFPECDIYSSYFIDLFPQFKNIDWSKLQYVWGIYISVSCKLQCIFQNTLHTYWSFVFIYYQLG